MPRVGRIIKIKIRIMKKIIAIIGVTIVLASCGSTKSYHAAGITPLNKQYSSTCR